MATKRLLSFPLTPSARTLGKYGLSIMQWLELAESQDGVCAVCRKLPPSGRLHIDHEHVKGFKNGTAAFKRKHVRGLLCSYCNRFLVAKNTCLTAHRARDYLWSYENG